MIEDLWSGLIAWSAQFVVPDWGALVKLIPLLLAAIVVLFLAWTLYRLATAGPTRRGVRRQPPVAPAGIHMPGPSFAPVLAAFGAFMLVFGLVSGGLWMWAGVAVLAITLLYWGREALRDYDRVAAHDAGGAAVALPTGALPAPRGAPPAGVHVPPPSFRPLLVAISMTILVAGLFIGGWALLLGFVALVITLLGWLRDARREYVAAEAADRTGHLDLGRAPSWPKATFAALAVIVVIALVLTAKIVPDTAAPTGSGAPAAGGASGGAAGGGSGAAASAGPSLPAADVTLTAQNIAFVQASLTAPAGKPFTVAFDNQDAGVPHDMVIRDASGAVVFKGDIVTGPTVTIYKVPALPAGQYPFVCSIHANMTGTLTVK